MVEAASVSALLRLNLQSFSQGGLNSCDLQPDVWQYRSAELGLLRYSGCEVWWGRVWTYLI